MCGRYSLTTPLEAVRHLFGVTELLNLQPRYNVAPTDEMPVVRLHDSDRELRMMRWGLLPFWAKDIKIGARMINARSETAATSGAFKSSFSRKLCLVVADGFYEWQKQEDGSKQAFRYTLADGGPFAFAGLWSSWHNPEKERLLTFTIMTTTPNGLVAEIHDRMPVILDPADYDTWLDVTGADAEAACELLHPFPAERMAVTAVSKRVNNVKNDDAACLEPA